jgi:exopolysaccharide biosynthesis predicted pyruvyltransferase EpsI
VSYFYSTIAGLKVVVIARLAAGVLPLVVIVPVMTIPVCYYKVKSGFSTTIVRRPSMWMLYEFGGVVVARLIGLVIDR